MPDEINVEITPPVAAETPPSDLTAMMAALLESNQALTLQVGQMAGELTVLRERTFNAEQVAASAESGAAVATDIANSAANIALETAVVVATETQEEIEEEEEEEEIDDNGEGEIPIVETPVVVVETPETPAAETPENQPEQRTEKRSRFFI